MINKVLDATAKYLRDNLPSEYSIDVAPVPKENSAEEREIVITLIRIEEETSRKAQYPYRTEMVRDDTVLPDHVRKASYPIQPPLSVNLEILISSHAKDYSRALSQISAVIDLMNSMKANIKFDQKLDKDSEEILDTINASMMTLTLEQTLSLWQTLKGTVAPAVMYKLRMITVKWEKDKKETDPVRRVLAKPRMYDKAETESAEFKAEYAKKLKEAEENPDNQEDN